MRQPKMPRTERVPTATLIGSRAPLPPSLSLPLHSHGQGITIPSHCLSPGIPSRRDATARCIPASWPCAYSAECEGGMVLRKWWHQNPAHWTSTCHAHCKSGIHLMACHNMSSSSNLVAQGTCANSVPKILIPATFQTSSPSSTISGGHSPALFHTGFRPRAAGPAPNFSAAKLKMVRVLSRSETT